METATHGKELRKAELDRGRVWASGTEVTIKRSTLGGKKMSELKGHMLNFLRLWDSELYYRSYLWKILKYIPGGKRRELMY